MNLPKLNALLNAISSLFLLCGFISIRRKKIVWHRLFMISAFFSSVLFLVSYVTYHLHAGHKVYDGHGISRWIYLAILFTHTVLAATVPFLAVMTVWLAWKGLLERHRKWASYTFPIWLYVSVTGVMIYWMLYRT